MSSVAAKSKPDWWKSGTPCPICKTPTKERNRSCSRTCARKLEAAIRDPEVEMLRKQKIAKRMIEVRKEIPNPVERPEVRAKISSTLKARGHTFRIRGGNGTGPTQCEMLLFNELVKLRPSWLWNIGYVVSNGARSTSQAKGIPTHYKLDVSSLKKMITIEVDGNSHRGFKAKNKDQKKEKELKLKGWIVLRCSNESILNNVNEVAMKIIESCTN